MPIIKISDYQYDEGDEAPASLHLVEGGAGAVPKRTAKETTESKPSPKWFEKWASQPALNFVRDASDGLFYSRPTSGVKHRRANGPINLKDIINLAQAGEYPIGGKEPAGAKLDAQIRIWLGDQKIEMINEILRRINFDPKLGTKPAEDFLKACLPEVTPLDVAALQHFVWQVKRKMTNQKVTKHIMTIFVGRTEAGKTYAVDRLLEPVWACVEAPKDTTALSDARWSGLFESYVVKWDELAKLEKANIESVKNQITSSFVTNRIMGTTITDKTQNNATLIATSEKSVAELILDSAGMRRFYEFTCRYPLDWAYIGSTGQGFDPFLIWRSVDEMKASPIQQFDKELKQAQEKLRHKDSVELWANDQLTAEWMSAKEAFQSYLASVNGENTKPFGSNGFWRRLAGLPGVERQVTTKGKFYRRK